MENKDQNLTLELSVNEINQILAALGNLPYAQVFALVQKIHQQIGPQLQDQQ